MTQMAADMLETLERRNRHGEGEGRHVFMELRK